MLLKILWKTDGQPKHETNTHCQAIRLIGCCCVCACLIYRWLTGHTHPSESTLPSHLSFSFTSSTPFFISSPLCHNLSLFHPKPPSLTRLSPPSSHLSHSPLSHSSHLFLPYRMQALRPVVARQLPQKHFALLMERAHRVPSSTQTVPAEHQQAALLSNWHRNHQAARVKINKRQIQIQVEIYAELLKSADQDDSSMSS